MRDSRSEAGRKQKHRNMKKEREAGSGHARKEIRGAVVEAGWFHGTGSNDASQHMQEYLSNA